MVVAIIAAIITAAILVLAIAVFWMMRVRSDTYGKDGSIGEVENVGVGATGSADDTSKFSTTNAKNSSGKASEPLSRRFLAFGALIGGVFTALAAKLWSMQIAGSEGYANKAEENLYTTISTPAPRGCIYDSSGVELVANRASQTVLADPDVANNVNTMQRLSTVLGIPYGVVRQRIKDETSGAQSQRVVASDVKLRDVAFISEHADAFEGVTVETRTVREYPYGALAAHILGYTGSPTQDELSQSGFGREIQSNDIVGKGGLEMSYDSILSGDQGMRKVMVDAKGNVVSVASETAPTKGSDLYLTIDSHAQYVADKILAETIAPEGDIGTGVGVAGAVVGINVQDGGVCVMASYPTYDPSYFTNGVSQEIWDLYNTEESNSPLINRVVNGQYAAASTFKAFTSMAGLNIGFADYDSSWECTGKWDGFDTGIPQKCWNLLGHGELDLHGGIVNSCDVVFYEIAKAFFDHGPEGTNEISETALQDYLMQYNFGSPTGIDLVDESSGRIPTPEWKKEHWRNVPSEAAWVGGDYTNMIIGQGDVLVTPLQLAVAYGAIATGKLMKPHLIKEVRNNAGDVVLSPSPEVIGEPDVNTEHLEYVKDSLHDMVLDSAVMAPLFNDAGIDAAGKSGTAEHSDRWSDSWFVAYAPYDNPKYVVACIVEEGKGGTDTAGPIVVDVLKALFESDAAKSSGETTEIGRIEGSSGHAVEVEYTPTDSGRTD